MISSTTSRSWKFVILDRVTMKMRKNVGSVAWKKDAGKETLQRADASITQVLWRKLWSLTIIIIYRIITGNFDSDRDNVLLSFVMP